MVEVPELRALRRLRVVGRVPDVDVGEDRDDAEVGRHRPDDALVQREVEVRGVELERLLGQEPAGDEATLRAAIEELHRGRSSRSGRLRARRSPTPRGRACPGGRSDSRARPGLPARSARRAPPRAGPAGRRVRRSPRGAGRRRPRALRASRCGPPCARRSPRASRRRSARPPRQRYLAVSRLAAVRLVFILRHPAAVRSLHGVFRLLDGNGHQVHLAFQNVKSGDAHRVLQQLAAECSNLTFDRLPRRAPEAAGWTQLTREIRLSADSFRYLEPRYEHADGLRARGLAKAPAAANRVGELAGKGGPRGAAALGCRRPLARALAAGASSRGAVRRRSGARPARRHPSERVGLAAVGLRPRGEAARRAHRLPRVQLGQPDQQGPRARRARTGCSSGTSSRSRRPSSSSACPPSASG